MTRYVLTDCDAGTIVDRDLDLARFIVDNDLTPDEVFDMERRFQEGRPHVIGGGAAPQYSIIRVREG